MSEEMMQTSPLSVRRVLTERKSMKLYSVKNFSVIIRWSRR